MCNTCDVKPEEHFENWLEHHLPVDDITMPREVTINDLAIDAILSTRLYLFTVDELMELYSLSDDKAREVVFVSNQYLSQIEDCLLDKTDR